jgi:hypothetical protein
MAYFINTKDVTDRFSNTWKPVDGDTPEAADRAAAEVIYTYVKQGYHVLDFFGNPNRFLCYYRDPETGIATHAVDVAIVQAKEVSDVRTA